ncbi:unnamed protein product, partial [Iphiclides podalirius]
MCLADSLKLEIKTLTKEVMLKVSLCFGHDIIINNSLPQTICRPCVEKIEDVNIFRQKIIQNQNILLKWLKDDNKDGTVDDNEHAKLENKENEILIENSNIKLELNEHVTKENSSPSKYELGDNGEKMDSEDDNISLSMIKISQGNKADSNQNEKHPISTSNNESNEKSNGQLEIYTNFPCLTCYKVTGSHIELLRHYNEEHKHADKLLEGKTSTEEKYKAVTSDDGSIQYKCSSCEKLFDSKRKINRHTISHIEDRPFLCKLCGRTYKTASEIVRHGRAHSGYKVPCRYQCGYSTVYLGALKEHERRHRTDYTYTCEQCGKGFQVLTWYEQHQNIHTGLKPFVCELCGVAFHMDRYLKAHMTTVHPQASSRRRFVCLHCSKPCDSKKCLTIHLKEHGITTKFLCDVCGKVLSDASQLKFHRRMHLNVRPYSCSDCGKSFARRCNLSLHSRTHSAQRAHGCPICERRYSQRSTLRRHVRRFHKGNLDPAESET